MLSPDVASYAARPDLSPISYEFRHFLAKDGEDLQATAPFPWTVGGCRGTETKFLSFANPIYVVGF
jgi:hypothetical protein